VLTGDFSVHLPEIETYAALFDVNNFSGSLDLNGEIDGKILESENHRCAGRGKMALPNFPVDSLRAHVSFTRKSCS